MEPMTSERAVWVTRATIALLLMATLLGCSPRINRFDAHPRRVCSGDMTTLSWAVLGQATLFANPEIPGTGSVASAGSKPLAVDKTTLFTIIARRLGREAYAEQEVQAFRRDEREIGEQTRCDGDEVVAVADVPRTVWDDLVSVDTVSGDPLRPIVVSHEGHVAILTPGEESSAFRGSRVSGPWSIRSPLLPGEVCGSRLQHPPTSLGVKVRSQCLR